MIKAISFSMSFDAASLINATSFKFEVILIRLVSSQNGSPISLSWFLKCACDACKLSQLNIMWGDGEDPHSQSDPCRPYLN